MHAKRDFLVSCTAVTIVSTVVATALVLPNVFVITCPPRPRPWTTFAVLAIPPLVGAACILVAYPIARSWLERRSLESASAVLSIFVAPAPLVLVKLGFYRTALIAGPAGMLIAALALRLTLPVIYDRPGECHCCGYDLTGNVSGICPECGTGIAGDSSTMPNSARCDGNDSPPGA